MVFSSAAGNSYWSSSSGRTQRCACTRMFWIGPRDEPAAVDAEVDVVALVRVLDVDDAVADLDLDPHLLAELARERLRVGLARLDAAAGELPQERQRRARRALGDEVLPVLLDHRPDDPDLPAHFMSPLAPTEGALARASRRRGGRVPASSSTRRPP